MVGNLPRFLGWLRFIFNCSLIVDAIVLFATGSATIFDFAFALDFVVGLGATTSGGDDALGSSGGDGALDRSSGGWWRFGFQSMQYD